MTTFSFVLGLLELVSLDVCLDRVRAGSAATDHETQATQNTARHKLLVRFNQSHTNLPRATGPLSLRCQEVPRLGPV